jgi:hypothetical protein
MDCRHCCPAWKLSPYYTVWGSTRLRAVCSHVGHVVKSRGAAERVAAGLTSRFASRVTVLCLITVLLGGAGAHSTRCEAETRRRRSRRWGKAVYAMWHLAPEAPPELFLDPALLEEAGAHGMAGGVQIWPLVFKGGRLWGPGPHNFPPILIDSSERPQEAAPLNPPCFASSRRPSHPIT